MRHQRTQPRLIDVADAASVSIATASRALSGSAGVSEQVASRVREAALDLGTSPTPMPAPSPVVTPGRSD